MSRATMQIKVEKYEQMTGHKAAVFALARGEEDGIFYSGAGEGWVARWDIEDPENGRLVAGVETNIFALHFLKDSNRIIAGNMNGGLHWIQLDEPEKTRNIAHHRKGVFSFLRIGDSLFSGGGQGLLTRWDLPSGRSVESLQVTAKSVRCLLQDPLSGHILAGASDGAIHFVHPEKMTLLRTLPAADQHSVFTLAFTPDGRYLLSGGRDAQLKVWDREQDFSLTRTINAHWFTINAIAMHPRRPIFATASRDKTVKLWHTETFELLKVLDRQKQQGHLNSVNRLLWLNDEILLSTGDDRSIIAWQVKAA